MNEKLIPCPICGSENTVRLPYNDHADIERCKNCNLTIIVPFGYTMWNTRPIEDELRKRIAELESAQRWTPVSERLPEDLQPTVIITKGGMTGIVRYLELYGREGFGSWSEDVTHWMPLPTPPEEHER